MLGSQLVDNIRKESTIQKKSLGENLISVIDETITLGIFTENLLELYKKNLVIKDKLVRLSEVLKNIQDHLIFIQNVLKTDSTQEILNIKLKNVEVSKEYQDLNAKENLSETPLKNGILFLENVLLTKVREIFNGCFHNIEGKGIVINHVENKISELGFITSRLKTAQIFLPQLATFDKDDLFSQDTSSETWRELHKLVNFKGFDYDDEKEESLSNPCVTFDLDYSIDSLRSLEEKQSRIKNFFMKIKQTSTFEENIFIDRLFPKITKEDLQEEYEQNSLTVNEEIKIDSPRYLSEKERKKILVNISSNRKGKIKIKIISSQPLSIQRNSKEKLKRLAKKTANIFSFNKETRNEDGVIIYINGRGFASSSSNDHENYLNQWASSLNHIIFSIEYRQAPENPYPEALDDVWQAYLWIIYYSEEILGKKKLFWLFISKVSVRKKKFLLEIPQVGTLL